MLELLLEFLWSKTLSAPYLDRYWKQSIGRPYCLNLRLSQKRTHLDIFLNKLCSKYNLLCLFRTSFDLASASIFGNSAIINLDPKLCKEGRPLTRNFLSNVRFSGTFHHFLEAAVSIFTSNLEVLRLDCRGFALDGGYIRWFSNSSKFAYKMNQWRHANFRFLRMRIF